MNKVYLLGVLAILAAGCDELDDAQPDLPSAIDDAGASTDAHVEPTDGAVDAPDAGKDAADGGSLHDAHDKVDGKSDLPDINMMVDIHDKVDAQEAGPPDISTDAIICNGVDCNDNIACTSDVCTDGGCVNVVQVGFCLIGGSCYKDKAVNSAASCQRCDALASTTSWTDDASMCPGASKPCVQATCTAGVCGTSVKAGSCLVSGACVNDSYQNPANECQVCDAAASSSGFSNKTDGTACASDSLTCTGDVCKAGQCAHELVSGHCLIAGACQASGDKAAASSCQACDPAASTSAWTTLGNGAACASDGLSCTSDVCSGGTCAHPVAAGACLIGGKCYAAGDKSASNPCMGCVPSKSTSAWSVLADDAACTGDGLSCTADVCKAGTCTHTPSTGSCLIGGKCHAKGDSAPTGGCLGCVPSKSTTAWSTMPDGSACASDGNSCTADVCKAGTCTHNLTTNSCSIGGKCYASGVKSPSNSCQGCVPSKSVTAWSTLPNGTSCTGDSYTCTSDVCNGSGTCTHPIKAGYCVISGKCYSDGNVSASNPCQACVYAKSQTAWSNRSSGSSCTGDSYACTSDYCNGSGTCVHPIKTGYCVISGKCYSDGNVSASNPCQACVYKKSQTAWSNRTSGSSCTGDKYTCTSDYCNGSGTCIHPIKSGYCVIAGTCYSDGAVSPSNPCQACVYKKSQTAWSNRTSGSSCTGDKYTCTSDYCNGSGTCIHPIKSGYCIIAGKCYSSGCP